MKTLEELRKFDSTDLQEELKKAQAKGFQTKFAIKHNEANNSHAVKQYRRYIAQIKTLLKEKQSLSDSK